MASLPSDGIHCNMHTPTKESVM